jgi:Ca2+-binding EF-hand superfamily protein
MPKGSAITPQEPSESTIAFYRKVFNSIDKKNTGKIQVDLINDLMEIISKKEDLFTSQDYSDALDRLEKGPDDTLTFDEFINFIMELNNPNSVIDAFAIFDSNKNGYISCDELKYILNIVNSELTEEELQEIFKMANIGKDGMIDYKEFVSFWNEQ